MSIFQDKLKKLLYKQEKAACLRYENSSDKREKSKKLLDKDINNETLIELENKERVKLRKATLNRNDGLGYERILGKSDLLSINYLELGLKVAESICRIQIRDTSGRSLGHGTGFLISPNLIMTNHHVLPFKKYASRSLAEFNFEDDINFIPEKSFLFQLKPTEFFYNNEKLDFAIVAVDSLAVDDETEITEFGFIRLIDKSGKALPGEQVTIIQHPNGSSKQIALRNNEIQARVDDFIHYETDTEPGSSGSPVFSDQWEVVALHHAGVPKRKNGKVLNKNDKPWKSSMGRDQIQWISNEGIRISSIIEHLKSEEDWNNKEASYLNELLGVVKHFDIQEKIEVKEISDQISYRTQEKDRITDEPERISIDEFYKKLEDETLTEDEISKYFIFDLKNSSAFNPAFTLNQELVPESIYVESDQIIGLANFISRKLRHKEYRRKLESGNFTVKIVTEGDSWFQYPFKLHDIVDYLMDEPDFAVYSLGAGGDLLRNILAKSEYIDAITKEQPHYFLISGGGNDLVGESSAGERELQKKLRNDLGNNADNAEQYLETEEFKSFENTIGVYYKILFEKILKKFPSIKILCHGYDYVLPNKGKWLGKPLENIGVTNNNLQYEILKVIIDRINEKIGNTASDFQSNVKFVDLRGNVGKNEWYDELHPTNNGFKNVSKLIIDNITKT